MSNILNFPKRKLMANLASVPRHTKPEPRFRVREDHEEYDNDPTPDTPTPKYMLTDDKSIYAYYQLTQAAQLDKTLDRATRLKGASIVNQIKTIKNKQIAQTIDMGSRCPKGRAAILLNDSFSEKPQRFVNCLSPSTYVCPHKHSLSEQWELMSHLTGRFIALLFDENGILIQRIEMSDKQNKIIEIPPHIYHSFVALEPCSYLEIRNCAYEPELDRVYASWAPRENSPHALKYVQQLFSAQVGDSVTIKEFND